MYPYWIIHLLCQGEVRIKFWGVYRDAVILSANFCQRNDTSALDPTSKFFDRGCFSIEVSGFARTI